MASPTSTRKRVGRGLGIEHGFEPGQPAELADETTARLQPASGVTGEIDRQIQGRVLPGLAAPAGKHHRRKQDEDSPNEFAL